MIQDLGFKSVSAHFGSHKVFYLMFLLLILSGLLTNEFLRDRVDKKVEKEVAQMQKLAQKIDVKYKGDFRLISNKKLLEDGMVDSSMFGYEPSNFKNSWGGGVLITDGKVIEKYDSIRMVYSGIPIEDCRRFGEKVGKSFHSVSINGIRVVSSEGPEMSMIDEGCKRASLAEVEVIHNRYYEQGTGLKK